MRGLLLSVAIVGLFAMSGRVAHAQTATVKVTSISPGKTYRSFGYGLHGLNSSQYTFLRHAETNGVRIWLNEEYQPEPESERANTQTQFVTIRLDARRELNDGPLGNGAAANCNATLSGSTASPYIDWAFYFADWESNGNERMFDELKRLGIEPVLQRELKFSNSPLRTLAEVSEEQFWQDRWNLWRHMFAIAYMAGSRWGFATWQLYNEPDHPENANIKKAQLLERWRIGADAIQLAIKTLNKRLTHCGKPTLTARIMGPTTGPGQTGFSANKPVDYWLPGNQNNSYEPPPQLTSRPELTFWCTPWPENEIEYDCYGRYFLNNRTQTTFYGYSLANADSFPTLFQAYSFHKYEVTLREAIQDVWTYLKGYPTAPPVMDVYVTETSSHNAYVWPEDRTADSPEEFSALGKLLIEGASATTAGTEPAKNVYVAQFRANDKKGGHFQGAGAKFGGVTNLGEVVRLVARALKGSRPRYPLTISGPSQSSLTGIASRDIANNMLYVLMSNTGSSSVAATIDLSSFNIGQWGEVETVSSARRGNAAFAFFDSSFPTYSIPSRSVILLSVPTVPVTAAGLVATMDATVKGGSNGSVNYGSSSSLYAAGDTNFAQGRNATFLRFVIPDNVDLSKVKAAVLSVYGQALTTGGVVGTEAIAHVYGIDNDSWWETSIKGSNAPNLAYDNQGKFSTGTTTRIADNYVVSQEATSTMPRNRAEFLGHLTGRAAPERIGTDVTQWIKTQTDRKASFLVTRDVRFDPVDETNNTEDTLTDAKRSLWMASRTASSSTQHPQLVLIW